MVRASALFVVIGLVAACSSSSSPTSSSDPTEPTPSSTTAKKPTDTPPATPPPASTSTPKTGDAACGDESSNQACQQCCVQNHQAGYKTYQDATIACLCGSGGGDAGAGACATECKDTLCKSTPANPDATCNTCAQNALSSQTSTCAQPVSTACQADKDCMALIQCVQPCSKKQ